MNKVVLDASALLALIKNEKGADIVDKLLGSIIMSSINVSEVAAILLDSKMTMEECKECIEPFIQSIIPFDTDHSFLAASLKNTTKHLGLSLGDRACLALAIAYKLPVYTADKTWTKLKLDCEVILIR